MLFRSAQQKPAFVERVAGATIFPTVVNTRTGTLGVLTGTLVVKPKNLADAAAIASTHGLAEGKAYPHLRTVFYRVRANTDIADVAARMPTPKSSSTCACRSRRSEPRLYRPRYAMR